MSASIKLKYWFVNKFKLFSKEDLQELIDKKKLVVNNSILQDIDYKVNPKIDTFAFNVKKFNIAKKIPYVYWLFNKPPKFITSYSEKENKPSIFNLATLKKTPFILYPITHLSFKSQGVMLLTNDAQMAYKLNFEEQHEIPHHYHILLNKKLTVEEETNIKSGIKIDKNKPIEKFKLKFLDSVKLGASNGYWYYIRSFESNDFLIKKIFTSLNPKYKVIKLIKIGIAHVRLPLKLKEGDYIQLRSSDIQKFKNLLGLK